MLKRRAAQQELRPPDASRKAAATATGVTWQHFARCAPAPLRSRLVVDRVRRGGQCGNQGAFTTTQNTTYSPRPRRRRRVGGEGERHPKKHQSSRPLPLLVFNQPNPPTPRFIRSIPYPIRSPKTTNAKPLLSAFPFAASRLRVRPTRPRIPIPPNNTQGATTLPHSSGDSPKDFHPCQSVFIRGRKEHPCTSVAKQNPLPIRGQKIRGPRRTPSTPVLSCFSPRFLTEFQTHQNTTRPRHPG